MRLVDVDATTEATFLRCLHDEAPDDPRVITLRKGWVDRNKRNGLRAKVLILDGGEVAGLCQYMPVEHTQFVGEGLLAIHCIWVHGYDHHIGNRQGNGYGRYILESIEEDARACGSLGVCAWGMDFPYWNPVSFYEHMGYDRADKSGMAVLVWKPMKDGASPPSFRRAVRRPAAGAEKVSLTVFMNGCCTGSCGECIKAREAVEGLDAVVDYVEIDTSDLVTLGEWGISMGTFLDGEPHREDEPPCTSDVLRGDILAAAERRGIRGGTGD